MSDKFKLVEAGSLPAGTVVIARTDGESMHGQNYLVVNGDKPHAMDVYMVLRTYGYRFPKYEDRLRERLIAETEQETVPVDEEIVQKYMSLAPNVNDMYAEMMEKDPEFKGLFNRLTCIAPSQVVDEVIHWHDRIINVLSYFLTNKGYLVNSEVVDFFTLLPYYKRDLERLFTEKQGHECSVDKAHHVLCSYLNNILAKDEV